MSDETTFSQVPEETLAWLTEPDNPAVAVMTRRLLLQEPDSAETEALWARRNTYEPVARILDLMAEDGTWAPPARDYQKYWGGLWQIHLLGELQANGDDERVQRAAAYGFSRQLDDGSWSASNKRQSGSIPCLTANVGRALARFGYARDERITAAIASIVRVQREQGPLACTQGAHLWTLNGYCHMLAPKVLLFLGEVPRDAWPDGAEELRNAAVAALRDKEVFRSLPKQSREFTDVVWSAKPADRPAARERFLAEHGSLEYGDKPGWLRFGFPLSYNSDALEALLALAAVGEGPRQEYEPALDVVRKTADAQMRWKLRTSFNGKMLADVDVKGQPSKWVTYRALRGLQAFGA